MFCRAWTGLLVPKFTSQSCDLNLVRFPSMMFCHIQKQRLPKGVCHLQAQTRAVVLHRERKAEAYSPHGHKMDTEGPSPWGPSVFRQDHVIIGSGVSLLVRLSFKGSSVQISDLKFYGCDRGRKKS